MKTLIELWIDSEKKKGSKFRFVDWNHKTRYFIVEEESEDGTHLEGRLDCGTQIAYPKDSDFWMGYHDGDEYSPRAV